MSNAREIRTGKTNLLLGQLLVAITALGLLVHARHPLQSTLFGTECQSTQQNEAEIAERKMLHDNNSL